MVPMMCNHFADKNGIGNTNTLQVPAVPVCSAAVQFCQDCCYPWAVRPQHPQGEKHDAQKDTEKAACRTYRKGAGTAALDLA